MVPKHNFIGPFKLFLFIGYRVKNFQKALSKQNLYGETAFLEVFSHEFVDFVIEYSVIKLVSIYIMIFSYQLQNTFKSTYFVAYLVISCLATKVHADFARGEKPQKK
jgi:hypothetical protein